MLAAKNICNDATLLDFWRDGEWLEFAPTTPRLDAYYAGSIDRDRNMALVFAWSPHSTFTPARVTIPGMGSAMIPDSGYWLVRPPAGDLIAERL